MEVYLRARRREVTCLPPPAADAATSPVKREDGVCAVAIHPPPLRGRWREAPEGVAAFIRQNTETLSPPLLPEIRLHLASESIPLWQKTEVELGQIGLPPPFWAFAWAGGQALARYILDHPDIVRLRTVADLASGSGLVAIAAAMAGARHIVAADIDRFALAAIELNCKLNGVSVETQSNDLLCSPPPSCDLIVVGDLFYEGSLAARLFEWLEFAHALGIDVLIGDPGRTYLPKERLEKIASYDVPVTRDLEDAEIKRSAVWRLRTAQHDA